MMTKDYKHVGGRDDAAPDAFPAGKYRGFLSGLVLGLAFAVSLHFYHVLQREPAAPPAVPESEPAPAADDRKETTPDYDFFEILSGAESAVPGHEESDAPPPSAYVLQAGSFRTQRTAEFLQEQLKALELESELQTVKTDDGDIWYRVRLGPYDSLSRVNNIRLELRRQGIESVLKKD